MSGYLDGAILAAGLTAVLALAVIAITVTMIALLVSAFRSLDREQPEPDWWPAFEAQLADYVAADGDR
jgi:hypothetical protein